MNAIHNLTTKHSQRGIALPTVLVLLLLSIISVLGAFKVGFLNEIMVGNISDYNRARAAAEALVRDAEMDILGRRPPYTTVQSDGTRGFPCRPNPPNSTTTLAAEAGYVGCRNKALANTPWFPRSSEEFDDVSDIVAANNATRRCKAGICMPLNMNDLSAIENNLSDMKQFGATYGLYTRNALSNPDVAGNPLLNGTGNNASAWYWVEAFRYGEFVSSGASPAGNLTPEPSASFVYRITAIAQGLKGGTRVVIKSTFVPYPASQGQ
ncbi:pilus assembly protein [Polaromonas naphthalenivorans]|uniref:Tfp pilus assembly protein PilX-like protein n=1 Tax=Polaromonas naphthalenivorans (strain CJ2) TaxID=365044 RepID=A1VRD3_POLNA|nr:pilus assembly protein [Polaromonas naphthalenivorans]ABM38211.1 Tfp pilus assembly protein PilX-like protein [Polaromonas naphthalenivorans CJ2]